MTPLQILFYIKICVFIYVRFVFISIKNNLPIMFLLFLTATHFRTRNRIFYSIPDIISTKNNILIIKKILIKTDVSIFHRYVVFEKNLVL